MYITTCHIKMPGVHNVMNTIAALATVSVATGEQPAKFVDLLQNIHTPLRRLEKLGEIFGIPVVDDFAHNPRQIEVTLEAISQRFPNKEIICIFEPSLYQRVRGLIDEIGKAFWRAKYVAVLDIVRGSRDTDYDVLSINGSIVSSTITKNGTKSSYYSSDVKLIESLAQIINNNNVILTLGASKPYRVFQALKDYTNG
jgi:UDP-N-acetylmuramate--alanine ligase